MSIVEEIALRQGARLGLIVLGLIAAAIYALVFCHRGPSAWKTLVKSIPMPAFALAAAVSFGSPAVILALVFSAVGDVALSRNGERAFLIGLIGFALAHLVYVGHFLSLSGGLTAPVWGVAALVLLAASTELWLAPHTGTMKWPVRIYVTLITAMGVTALGLPGMPLAVIGAFAFLASDTILAMQLFRMSDMSRWQRPASVALWLLYAGGQFAILAGAGWATPLFQIL